MNSTPVRNSQFDRLVKKQLEDNNLVARVIVKGRCDKCKLENIWPCAHYTGRDSPWRASGDGGDAITRMFFEGDAELYNREMMAEEEEDSSYLFPHELVDKFKFNSKTIGTWLLTKRPIVWVFFDPTPGPVSAAACIAVTWKFNEVTEKHEFMVRCLFHSTVRCA